MASNFQNTSSQSNQSFNKGLVKDLEEVFTSPGIWTHARNAVNNSKIGDLGVLGNEPSNYLCASAPYTIIGAIHLYGDKWQIHSTNDISSEIGIFDESDCSYIKSVNDPCLGYKKSNPIIGVAREKEDCGWQTYWADNLNPDRTMPAFSVPWIQSCQIVNDCNICVDTTSLNCDAIRLARLATAPCIRLEKGPGGGTLPNGSYYALIAYVIKGIKVTDYYMPSDIQSIFTHDNLSGALDVHIDSIDTANFDEFQLVIVSTVNQQTVAKDMGIYSVRQKTISFDQIKESLPTVPIQEIPLRTPLFTRSKGMYENGEFLLRIGPSTDFDFNYQPLANQITLKWESIEYPADYYQKGGNKTSYLRDEVYAFFIRWVYNTGNKSASYHIPGRAAFASDMQTVAGTDAQLEINAGITPYRWIVENTATMTAIPGTVLPDGGVVIAEGLMGYWESTEIYPDNKPEIWNASAHSWSDVGNINFDLCGHPIRHHRMPDNFINYSNNATNHISNNGNNIRLLGVKLENVRPPKDNNGVVIPGIIGYEVLRGTREGNKSVIAKGIINNMGHYVIEGNVTNRIGAYPNYPYNDLRPDPFLSATKSSMDCKIYPAGPCTVVYNPFNAFSENLFTFHSPDTQFKNPFLSVKELRISGQLLGEVDGRYQFPDKHPKEKVITNLAFFVSLIAGIGIAAQALNGKKSTTRIGPRQDNSGAYGVFAGLAGIGTWLTPVDLGASSSQLQIGYQTAYGGLVQGAYEAGGILALNIAGFSDSSFWTAVNIAGSLVGLAPGTLGAATDTLKEDGAWDTVPLPLRALQLIPTLTYYFSEGTDTSLRLIKAVLPYRQYALQYVSHGFYNQLMAPVIGNSRRQIDESIYLTPNIHDFGTNVRINNLFRGKSVAVSVTSPITITPLLDNTRQRIQDRYVNPDMNAAGVTHHNPTVPFKTNTTVHYAALKQRIRNQYGQMDGIQQVPVSFCMTPLTSTEIINDVMTPSEVFFNGDTYVSRYTEKNTFFYFYDWLYDQPDGYEFDYESRKMIPHPTYWVDFTNFDANEFFDSFLNDANTFGQIPNPSNWVFPNDQFVLDKPTGIGEPGGSFNLRFGIKESYFYIFSSGVRDFFVESEINTDQRDWGELVTERHYDPYRYTDVNAMFNAKPETIKAGNFFKYDLSLSISRLFNNFISWGNMQSRYYNPLIAETCYTFYPDRVIYSLPQSKELRKDNWLVFLTNNYKEFKSTITAIKSINKSGICIFFETDSPLMYQGVDTLQTDLGTKVTIGDGGLFSQPVQSVSNADSPYEYGSCQNRLSIANTPVGLFWISQNQGKIFQFGSPLDEISLVGVKYWLAQYLPYKIIEDFPTFSLLDNTIIGVGCQTIYDSQYSMLYFTKRDYKLKPNLAVTVTYVDNDNFLVDGITPIKLGDPLYFDNASWVLSYDPKEKIWIANHDWHPNLLLPAKTHFMSIKDNGIWKHNELCNSYCNFYGVDYPWEVEHVSPTGSTIMTLRSFEYIMECYRFQANCLDKFHVLDFNFDEAIVFNTEQVSGLLKLNLQPKNNPFAILTYPQINFTDIDISFTKEENKYRFNQFWDITDDRGEFNLAAQRPIWITEPNGYIKSLNPANLKYDKSATERKKFRHYINNIFLRKKVSGNTKMLLWINTDKFLISPR